MLGIVVIGRNEGERLARCLMSICAERPRIVYVDSGSTDGSAEKALELGAHVTHLSADKPFSAGRARNEGFAELLRLYPTLTLVQFVDGDCELMADWIETATKYLSQLPEVAIVCGRRKERFPDRSIYNKMCDVEWDTPVGETESCGGDFVVRVDAFRAVGGFNAALIAGEEPELCYRLRRTGWRIHRIDAAMTLHDAAIVSFRQWARRTSRSGHAYAERAALHWRNLDGYCWNDNARIAFWAAALPAAIAVLSIAVSPYFAALLAAYPLQYAKTYLQGRRQGLRGFEAWFAALLLLGKWPECYGQLVFLARSISGARKEIIEYK